MQQAQAGGRAEVRDAPCGPPFIIPQGEVLHRSRSHSNEYLGVWKNMRTSELGTHRPHHTNSSKNTNRSASSQNQSRWRLKVTMWPRFPAFTPRGPNPRS